MKQAFATLAAVIATVVADPSLAQTPGEPVDHIIVKQAGAMDNFDRRRGVKARLFIHAVG